MATIESRLLVLERSIAAIRTRPLPFFVLPREGRQRRADIQARIDARTADGQPFIVYEIV